MTFNSEQSLVDDAVNPYGPLPAATDAEPVTVQSGDPNTDGAELGGYAWWASDPAPAVLFLHGWGQDASYHYGRARDLHARGWNAVSLGLRGWPGSDGEDEYGLHADDDLGAALRMLNARPSVTGTVVLGFSMGGLIGAVGVANAGGAAGLVMVSSPTDLPAAYRDTGRDMLRTYYDATLTDGQWTGCSPITYVAELTVPTLVVVGTEDRMIPPSQGRALAAALPSAQLLEIEGMRHVPADEDWALIMERTLDLLPGATD
ncbi:serine aminopeptidase S33 family [Antricoccus suffuscus]|uniref:Serine aminopeptidase S33 family n=1 Tax=Antricoccus suffuscus TaxID=1629062 RepID=A0A2T1A4Q5_9ACTN|nr:alpha/beta fold hydrolase [Antricoccus suffuscus]PRZ43582.1 serine aminopeptidase S33 family [Antricoccus suffuscus]